jgi:hypothetical protein
MICKPFELMYLQRTAHPYECRDLCVPFCEKAR